MIRFSPGRALSVARKEFMHVRRDPFTMAMAIGMPAILVLFFGFIIDFTFGDIQLSVFDNDRTPASRTLARTFSSSGFFLAREAGPGATPLSDVEAERSFASLIIDPGFEKDVKGGGTGEVQVLMDGSNNLKSGVVAGYLAGVQQAAAAKLSPSTTAPAPLRFVTDFLYNGELRTQWFIVPGLIVIVTGLLSILLTALTIAREWENGSMELLLSTPVTPLEIIAGKIVPYVAMGLAGITFVYAVSRLAFAMPFLGSHILFALACLLFIATSLAQGILISIVTRQQQKAMQFSFIIGLLPSLLLSGFIFPIESMPVFFRYFTLILPPRHFMEILRGIMLKGAGLADLAAPFAALLALNIVIVAAAAKRFKRDLEP